MIGIVLHCSLSNSGDVVERALAVMSKLDHYFVLMHTRALNIVKQNLVLGNSAVCRVYVFVVLVTFPM